MRTSNALLVGSLAIALSGTTALAAAASEPARTATEADSSPAAVKSPSPKPKPPKTAGPDSKVNSIGQHLTPAGRQTTLGNLPLNSALHPDGRTLLITNDGQGVQSLQLVDLVTGTIRQTLEYASPESLYIGVTWNADGTKAYASAAANNKVRVLDYKDGKLTEGKAIEMPSKDPEGKNVNLYPAGLALTPDGKKLVVAGQLANAISVVDLASGKIQTTRSGHRPMFVVMAKDGSKAYITDQGADTVDVLDLKAAEPVVTGTIKVGLHPNKAALSADGSRLYVSNGDGDSVSIVNTKADRTIRTVRVAPASGKGLVGSNPTGIALDEKAGRAYVTLSGNNAVAVLDLRTRKVLGRVPTAWYPTQAVVTADGSVHVTNAKGLGAGPNFGPGQPDPTAPQGTKADPQKYTGSMQEGTLSSFRRPGEAELARYTKRVAKNNAPVEADKAAVVPSRAGQKSPIKHVIYIVKENRTYDQVMGSLGKGNGEPSINLFGDESAPNMRQLARQFVTLDNFYADAEVSANGWNWVAQANSNPFAEQLWPANYSGRGGYYTSENAKPELAAQDPNNSYLWQRFDKAGVSFKNFGFYVEGRKTPDGLRFHAEDPVLNAKTDHRFMGYNLACPDSAGTFTPLSKDCLAPRVDRWLETFRKYEKAGSMPTVQFVRFGNDHTSGTKPGTPTPRAMVADNDYAFGRLVEAVSHSKFWKDTVILATEDDAQNGPDHVDAHRTLAWAISPYTQTGKVDSTFYSTASMVRTVGLFAGIGPLTQFDDYSTPMGNAFSPKPMMTPYKAIKPTYDMKAINGKDAPMAAISAKQSLAKEDQIDEKTFNEAIWKSIKGANSTMPAPKHDLLGDSAAAEKRAEQAAEENAKIGGKKTADKDD